MQRQAAIEEEYSNAESLHIAIASANSLQFLNGTVHPFGLDDVAPHAESIDDALLMTVEHLDDIGYFWDIGNQRSAFACRVDISVRNPYSQWRNW